ncbi:MAG TPA: zinc ribbon domain-containing protein [Candidatus Dormibacteraeota bacterium]|nr:zinc ribbon domain-containing protein [Candidatus Dormibacteraeota bacterium]
MPTNSTTSSTEKVLLGCSKCGAALPDEAQFCLKCGNPVTVARKEVVAGEEPPRKLVQPRRKPRIFLWVLLAVLLGLIGWTALSDNPFAQGIQDLVGLKHDQPILANPFSVNGHNFRYYKFTLPEGSMNVSIVGQFASTSADGKKAGSLKPNDKADGSDSDVEVYVLSEEAFAVWQNGYATNSVYESGRVSKGTLQAELPAGAGVYYLVFSNKFSPRTAKNVNANILLRYKSWMPEWVRSIKERFSNWIGS